MRIACIALALLIAGPSMSADKAPPKKRQVAHKKASPEQIRRFNELQKKRQTNTK